MKRSIGTVISLAFTAVLFFGTGSLHWFAFYVMLVANVLSWLVVMLAFCSADLRAEIRSSSMIWGLALAGISIAALLATGHPALAASRLLLQSVLIWFASTDEKAREVSHD